MGHFFVWAAAVGLTSYYAGEATASAIESYGLYAGAAVVAVLIVGWLGVRATRRRVEERSEYPHDREVGSRQGARRRPGCARHLPGSPTGATGQAGCDAHQTNDAKRRSRKLEPRRTRMAVTTDKSAPTTPIRPFTVEIPQSPVVAAPVSSFGAAR
jgi:hypothetical protein